MHTANSAAAPRPTRLYPSLLGLRFAPIWAGFAVFFFMDAFASLPRNSPHRAWPLIPAIVLSAIAHRYLNRTFGVVRTAPVGTGVLIAASLATVRVELSGIASHTPAASAWWGMYWTACTLACLWNHRLLVRSFNDGRTR